MTESLSQHQEDSNELPEKEDELNRKNKIGELFDSYDNGNERISKLISSLQLDLFSQIPHLIQHVVEVRQKLEDCAAIEDRQEFIEKVFLLSQLVFDLKKSNPAEFESVERKIYFEQSGLIEINDALWYGVEKSSININLTPVKQLGIAATINLVTEGLKYLAKIVDQNKNINEITAESWIIGKNPRVIEKFGFTLGEMKINQKGEKIGSASMDRETFLKKYLKE